MYIKIEHKDKTQLHECESYFLNQLQDGVEIGIQKQNESLNFHFKQGEPVNIYIMNEYGKTIDRI